MENVKKFSPFLYYSNKSYMGYPTSSRKLNFTHNTVILILGDYNSADKFQSNKLT